MNDQQFPIMQFHPIPWEVIAPFEAQAISNHSQSLRRLAERGGLDVTEAVAVLERRQWRKMDPKEAQARLDEICEAHENSPLSVARRELTAALAERDAARAERDALRSEIESHAPEGRNVTNWQHFQETEKLRAQLAEREEDGRLLDWLEADGNIDRTHCDAMSGPGVFFVDNHESKVGLRAALRAAIGKEGK